MDILSRDDLKNLSEKRDGWHVSIFMPTHRAGPETQQDPIRLKNLLGQAEERLVAAGLRPPEAEARLEPASKLIQDGLFWQHQSDGLALFVSRDIDRHHRLPLHFEELVVVAERFHIKPLLPLLSGDGRFYVLALSQGEARLLQGTRYGVSELDLAGAPASLTEALSLDDPERRLQFHTASGPSGGQGSRPAMFHGQGDPSQNQKDDILRYFQKLDSGVQEWLAGEQAPLVLAGVDYLLPLYQEANTYPHLIDEGIEGNPDNLSAQELHQRAWTIVQPRFLEEQEGAAQRYRQAAATEGASDNLSGIVPAAYHGRVETLFVALGLQHWGTFDPATNEVRIHQDAKPGDQDLADLAAVQTLLHGGSVYAVEPEQMPAEASLAALLRY
ncbi:MAG: hypothetical protein P8189_01685 [Anaerolineae bacterium]|jgi:hypothetical protein